MAGNRCFGRGSVAGDQWYANSIEFRTDSDSIDCYDCECVVHVREIDIRIGLPALCVLRGSRICQRCFKDIVRRVVALDCACVCCFWLCFCACTCCACRDVVADSQSKVQMLSFCDFARLTDALCLWLCACFSYGAVSRNQSRYICVNVVRKLEFRLNV